MKNYCDQGVFEHIKWNSTEDFFKKIDSPVKYFMFFQEEYHNFESVFLLFSCTIKFKVVFNLFHIRPV